MDVQLAFNTYALITYIVSYIGKDETGLTKLLMDCPSNLLTFANHAFAAMTIANYQVNVIVKVDMRPT